MTGNLVIVHTKDGSYQGHVASNQDDGVVLEHVTLLGEGEPDRKLAGTSWIDKGRVLFAQSVPRDESVLTIGLDHDRG